MQFFSVSSVKVCYIKFTGSFLVYEQVDFWQFVEIDSRSRVSGWQYGCQFHAISESCITLTEASLSFAHGFKFREEIYPPRRVCFCKVSRCCIVWDYLPNKKKTNQNKNKHQARQAIAEQSPFFNFWWINGVIYTRHEKNVIRSHA